MKVTIDQCDFYLPNHTPSAELRPPSEKDIPMQCNMALRTLWDDLILLKYVRVHLLPEFESMHLIPPL